MANSAPTRSIRIARNAVAARVFDADNQTLLEIHRLLSYNVSGAAHTAAFQSGGWNGKSSFFDFRTGTFPAGFTYMVVTGLRRAGVNVQLIAKPLPAPKGPLNPVVDAFETADRYNYQPDAVDRLLRHGQVIIQVATGGGKSRIARIALARIDRRSLFLTTRSVLMHQMKRQIEEMTGEPVAVLGDGEWGIPYTRPDGKPGRKLSQFCVGMVQTLAQRLQGADPTSSAADQERQVDQRDATRSVLEKFEFVIVEEAHEVSSDQFWRVMSACKNAAYRMALTATPFMKDDEEANMRLLGSCGPVALQVSEKLLIDRGILARPYFKFLSLDPSKRPAKLYRSSPWQRAYELGIVENQHRNDLIVQELVRGKSYGLNGMCLVQRKDHGFILNDKMRAAGLRSTFIFGDSNQAARDHALGALGRGEYDVLIGSTILDVGVDVPSVGMIAMAGGGKAEVAVRQRIGRGLREKKKGPNAAFIIDVDDDFNTHLRGHAVQRQGIITSTPGFAEGVVPDFDFEGVGLTRTH
jgi:superfamily II DNA or RNA helicase